MEVGSLEFIDSEYSTTRAATTVNLESGSRTDSCSHETPSLIDFDFPLPSNDTGTTSSNNTGTTSSNNTGTTSSNAHSASNSSGKQPSPPPIVRTSKPRLKNPPSISRNTKPSIPPPISRTVKPSLKPEAEKKQPAEEASPEQHLVIKDLDTGKIFYINSQSPDPLPEVSTPVQPSSVARNSKKEVEATDSTAPEFVIPDEVCTLC